MNEDTAFDATTIAVTGVACRLPGARNHDEFWSLLRDGREALTRFTDEEIAARGVPKRLWRHPDFVPVSGLIDGQDQFDPEPFGLTENEAALMDPQQRLFLECAWQALEQAGHGCGHGAGTVGVFAGALESSYLASNLRDRWDPTYGGKDSMGNLQTAISTQTDYLPLQTAYRLNLTGPAVAVNTTCSTSLVAVHMAVQSLLAEECDTALAGGVSLIIPQGCGYLYMPDGIFSADGHVRAFSANGTGVVYTQGAGTVVLRRLEDALADGDPVLAVVRGSAINNDGAYKTGFTAPSMRGQARVIAEALAIAGLSPRDIGYVEAHGTGTPLGDPIETAALRQVFGPADEPWCKLGSVKSNIGHANTAAGIASFIKTVLAIQHRTLPASLHAEPLNENLALAGSPFEVITETQSWTTPPNAGVSAFGIGGTNAHVVLGPAPAQHESGNDALPQVVVLSAHSEAALEEAKERLAERVDNVAAADAAYTLQHGRAHFTHRLAVCARDGEVGTALRSARAVQATSIPPRVVFAFPGGGSQYAGMGAELYASEEVFAECVDDCAKLFLPLLNEDIRDVLTGDPASPAIQHRARTAASVLPALFATSLATAQLLQSWGVRPDVLVGHSLGEYAAAVTSGALSLADAVRLVTVRAVGMSETAGRGGLLAVPLSEDDVQKLLADHPDVDLAVVNAPESCVVSGADDPLAALEAELLRKDIKPVRLHLDGAAHSRLVEPVLPRMLEAATGLPRSSPTIPVVSTLTGRHVTDELGTAEYWARQLREPVRFSEALRTSLNGEHPALLVQVGPGSALAGLARRHNLPVLRGAITTFAIEDGDSDLAAARSALGSLWTHGVEVDFTATHRAKRRRVPLPGYAFQHRSFWIEPPASDRRTPRDVEPDSDEPLQVRVWQQHPPADPGTSLSGRWLVTGANAASVAEVSAVLRQAGAEPVSAQAAEAPLAGAIAVVDVAPSNGAEPTAVADEVLAHAELARVVFDHTPPVLLQVTRNAVAAQSTDRPMPSAAAVRVIPRVIGQETSGLVWRTLDLDTDSPLGPAVLAELRELTNSGSTPDSGVEVALRGGCRWISDIVPWRPAITEQPEQPEQSGPTPIAVITGGLGDVGLTTAAHLARQGMRVVITSRSAVPTNTVSTNTASTDAEPGSRNSERVATLNWLADQGLPVEVRRLDAADTDGTAALLAELAEEGRIELVVHAAGVVASADLQPMRAVGSEHVLGHLHAKASGALALRSAIDALPPQQRPRTVLLMSSAGTLVGGIGMGPYVASNGFLDAFAVGATENDGPQWISVVWDAWKVGPMGTERAVRIDYALDAATGMGALDRILAARRAGVAPPVVAVSITDLRQRMAEIAGPHAAPASTEADGNEGELTGVASVIARLWSELFGVPVTSPDADFFALGGHSLLATRMLAVVRERYGAALNLRDLLEAPTVGGLAALVSSSVDVEDSGWHDDEGSDGTFPLSRAQHGRWAIVGADYLGIEYDCPELDIERYERAWNQVIARHLMLRSTITPQGRIKTLDESPWYRIRVYDLTELSEKRCRDRLHRLRERFSRGPATSDQWPLVEIQAARQPSGRTRLFIKVNTLICDGPSWWLVDREIRHFYEHPDTPLREVGTVFTDCVEALDRRDEWERAAAYWRPRLGKLAGPPALPVPEAAETEARHVRHSARLDQEQWAGLRNHAADRGVTPVAVLLAAYAETLAAWSGNARFGLPVALLDRPAGHPGINVVVGDFTSLLWHEVDCRPGPFAELARATERTLATDLEHGAFSAFDVLDEWSAGTAQAPTMPVTFTSALGTEDVVGDHDFQWVGEQVSMTRQSQQTWLDHQAWVHQGELLLHWDTWAGVLPGAEVERFFTGYVERLRTLATDPTAWGETGAAVVAAQDVLLPLRAGSGDHTLFLVHPSGGDTLCYVELARLLDERVNVVGLTDPALMGGSAPDSIPRLAAAYVDCVRQHQSSGPYLLGGWSMGGSLAQEMACQLHELGARTELLLMLDSNSPSYITAVDRPTPEAEEVEVLLRHLGSLEGYLGVPLGVSTQAEREALAELPIDQLREVCAARLRDNRLLGPKDDLRERVAVFARHLHALAEHQPRHLAAGHTTTLVVRADQTSPHNSGVGMGVDDTPLGRTDLGWQPLLADPPEITGIDAHHYSLLRPPAVNQIAELINAALADVLAARK